MRRNLEALIADADADDLADRLESYEPKPEDFDAPLPPLIAVKLAAFRRDAAEQDPGC